MILFSVAVILAHCYYALPRTRRSRWCGHGLGRAVRWSIVAISILDFFLSSAIWGTETTVRIAG
ncbi:ABC transporter permease [Kibdelosporangium philippinense]|uniref:ABC transporter permease n=1 Tax=Kibdelosporangium philippinense TaxID=211113 RepID=UPI003623BFD4